MSLPVTIVFQDMTPSPALRADIERHAEHLARFVPRLHNCHVTLRHNEGRHRQGNRYLVHVRVTLPGGEFEAGRTAERIVAMKTPMSPYAMPSMHCVGSWRTSCASAVATSKPMHREARSRRRLATHFFAAARTIA